MFLLTEVVYYVMSQAVECQVGRFWSHADATFLAFFAVGSYHFDRAIVLHKLCP